MFLIMFAWALGYKHKEIMARNAVVWSVRLYTFQLAILATSHIAAVMAWYKQHETVYKAMFLSGLILNDEPAFNVIKFYDI